MLTVMLDRVFADDGMVVVWEILINLISYNLSLLESLRVFQYSLAPFQFLKS